jgi:hypothetical protein
MAAEIHCIINLENGIQAYKKILTIASEDTMTHFRLAECYAESYSRHKQSLPTSYNHEHFRGYD